LIPIMAMPPAETDLKDDAIDRPLPMSNAWPGKAREFQQADKLSSYPETVILKKKSWAQASWMNAR
jgi:hypothetical protein